LFAELDREFGFTLDACATADNAKCPRFFDRKADGLVQR
jgi:site-specific DNA-methyltransferase (adenine-specific)